MSLPSFSCYTPSSSRVSVCARSTPANRIDHISKNTVIATIPNVGLHGGDGVRVAHSDEAPEEVG